MRIALYDPRRGVEPSGALVVARPAPMKSRSRFGPARWSLLLTLMAVGYLIATRSFAYIGIPPAKLFIGEIALGAFLITRLRPALNLALVDGGNVSAASRFFQDYRWTLLIFLCAGMGCLCCGLMQSFPPVPALQCFAFNYYSLYLLPAVWLGVLFPESLPRLIRWLAVANGVYGIIYIAVLNSVNLTIPGSPDVPVFGPPNGSAVAILGLLCLSKDQRLGKWTILVLMLDFVVMLGMQVRAEWFAFGLGLAALAFLHRPSRGAIVGFVGFAALLGGLAFVADVKVPAPSGRGGEISTRGVIGRMLATIDPDLAGDFVDNAEDVAGTIDWRKIWWKEIWKSVNDSPDDRVFFTGHGYGFALTDLVSYIDADTGLRTPHNVFYYTLGYAGWTGVVCLALFQGSLAWGLWRVYRRTRSPLGLIIWLCFFADAFFSNELENPFGAIPFYVLVGLSLAPNWRLITTPQFLFSSR